jgi:hypothetical protein
VDGSLWRADGSRQLHLVRRTDVRITQIVAVSDRELYVGYANGDVMDIDLKTLESRLILHASHGIRQIATKGDVIAVSTNGDIAYLGVRLAPQSEHQIAWTSLAARVGHLSLSSEFAIAACSDGAIWLYSIAHRSWLYLTTGGMNLGWTTISDDNNVTVTLDSEGHIVWLDLRVVRDLL